MLLFDLLGTVLTTEKLARTQPWYPDNYPRELYSSLKEAAESGEQKVPDTVLRAALLKWAAEDVRQLLRMNELKPNLATLHQRGSVGDDIWVRFTTSHKLAEVELNEIAQEAERLHKGWSKTIIPSAVELTQNAAIRKRLVDFADNKDYRAALDAAGVVSKQD